MSTVASGFDREQMARHYAKIHYEVDPGVRAVYYLPTNAPEREVRLLEVNDQIVDRELAPLEPLDFGVDVGQPGGHKLCVLDLTPARWEKVQANPDLLPATWTLDGMVRINRRTR